MDPRVWLEARALQQAGYRVSIISPKGPQCESSHATIEGIEIYRYRAWTAGGRNGYLIEYAGALVSMSLLCLALKVYRSARFRVLQGCDPPDAIFLIALLFKPLGVKFVFDHHDLSPELYEVKCGKLQSSAAR